MAKRKNSSIASRTTWPGWVLFLLSVVLSLSLSKIWSSLVKMNTISKFGNEVYLLLIEQGFLPDTAEIITAQAAHESANFSSKIFLANNNPFGMKLATERKTTAIGEKFGHAKYTSLESAIKDYRLYYTARKYPEGWKNSDAYIQNLKDHFYFEGNLEAYKKAVRHFLKLYFGE
jgi:hypothetical protein